MLIALVGLPYTGKKTIADYLCVHHGFNLVQVRRSGGQPSSASEGEGEVEVFDSAESLLDYATANWQSQLVTLDLTTVEHLEVGFDKRPWFLLVSVEAPLSVRWARSKR